MTRVAVDALGGDNAPGEVILGALDGRRRRDRRDALRPRRARHAGPAARRDHRGDRDGGQARRGRAREAGLEPRRRRARRRRRRRRRRRLRRQHRRDARRGPAAPAAPAGRDAPGDRRPDPRARRARASCSTPARTPTPAPSTSSSSRTWAPSSARSCSASTQPGGAAPLDRRGGREGQPADARGAPAAARGRTRSTSQGNAESRDLLRGAADVVVTDGFTGNVALKLLEGTIKELLDALREEITATDDRQARRPADPARRAAAPHAARPGHLRRRLPARPARAWR